jgi:hypothetical protein
MFPELTPDQIRYVASQLRDILSSFRDSLAPPASVPSHAPTPG